MIHTSNDQNTEEAINTMHHHERNLNNYKQDILKKLICVSLIAAAFMTIEIVGGIVSNSIAILSDAAHMFSDALGFCVSIIAVWISMNQDKKTQNQKLRKAEIVGAIVSIVLVWGLTACLCYFAVMRIINLDEVEVKGKIMFIVACLGLLCNITMMKILHEDHGSGHSHNHSHASCSSNKHVGDKNNGHME